FPHVLFYVPLRFPLVCAFSSLRSFPTRRSADLHRSGCYLSFAQVAPRCWFIHFGRHGYLYVVGQPGLLKNASAKFHVKPYRGILDRKSTRLNSSHVSTSYAVFCLRTKKRGWWEM